MKNVKKSCALAPFAMLWFSVALTFLVTFVLNLSWFGGAVAFAFIFPANMALDIIFQRLQKVT